METGYRAAAEGTATATTTATTEIGAAAGDDRDAADDGDNSNPEDLRGACRWRCAHANHQALQRGGPHACRWSAFGTRG